ncbi:hypothetical protein Mro03_42930 [Microbispora rosea subsp. rosea]|nr:hypothetical protein Mro03_42930 [Microbispora rosea subsp. rosea]
MGSVEKRVRDGKVTYLARWRDDARRQRKRSFSRKIDAERFLAQVEADILRGQYVDPSDKTTVIEYSPDLGRRSCTPPDDSSPSGQPDRDPHRWHSPR